MIKFLNILETIPEAGQINIEIVRYCERFLEFVIDLEALLPTRRFFNTVLDDSHLVVRCSIAPLMKRQEGKLFSQVSNRKKLYKCNERPVRFKNQNTNLVNKYKLYSLRKFCSKTNSKSIPKSIQEHSMKARNCYLQNFLA